MRHFSRRSLLGVSGAFFGAVTGLPSLVGRASAQGRLDWDELRDMFDLSSDSIHMSTMLITSHPAPVREAIERHRQALDADPVEYLERRGDRLTEASRAAAADYLGLHPSHVALTDSTTMGVGLAYTGLPIREDQEILTTKEDYFVTHESLRHLTERTGASERRIALFDRAADASADEIVERIASAIRPETRLVALTWVHSSTGLKIPVSRIAAALREANAERDEEDQILFGLDGVHGFGVEAESFFALGVDFLMAGCHKWLFGPRGTGILAMSQRGLAAARPTVPSFDDGEVFAAWYVGREPRPANTGQRMTPGGFKPFEHRWALAEAFALHERLGRERVAERTHELAGALKERLAALPRVTVRTPMEASLSAGIVAFDVDGLSSQAVVRRLRAERIIGSVAPYPSGYVRLTPSIRNTEAEIERVAEAVAAL